MLSILAAALVALSLSPAHARTIWWAGRTWTVKSGDAGPGPNHWSDSTDSVRVDDDGALHLAIRREGSRWLAAEVTSTACTGFGLHRFYVDAALDELDENVIFAPFLYADDDHEIDIEFARWGDRFSPDNAQYVVQPAGPLTLRRFTTRLHDTWSTHSIDWQEGVVRFQSLRGHYDAPPDDGYVIAGARIAGGVVPHEADDLHVHINLWLMGGEPPADGHEVEVVVTGADLPPPTHCWTPGPG